MSCIISVTSGKGGVGKSTVAVNLALSLVKYNKKAVVLELDCGLRCLDLMLSIDNAVYDLSDALSGECNVSQAVLNPYQNSDFSVILAPNDAGYVIDKDRLKMLCDFLSGYYDYIILDTPAGITNALSAAMYVSNAALVVSNTTPICVRDAEKVSMLLKKSQIKNIRLVINALPQENDEVPDIDKIIDTVGARLIAVIPEDDIFKKSVTGRTKKECKNNMALLAFDNLALRITGKETELLIK